VEIVQKLSLLHGELFRGVKYILGRSNEPGGKNVFVSKSHREMSQITQLASDSHYIGVKRGSNGSSK
jgi:hypothetical protein